MSEAANSCLAFQIKVMRYSILILLLFGFFMGQAQNETDNNTEVTIEMKSGSVLVGRLISYDPNTETVVEISGNQLTFDSQKIKKIVMKTSTEAKSINRLKTKKIYNRTNFALLSNANGNGISLNHSVLYQHSRWVGVGIGGGIDNYYFSAGRNVYPLFLEFRSFLVDRNSSPYVSLKSGYGFTFSNEDLGQTLTRGGFLINPTFGYRIGSSGVFMDFYLGLRFQDAIYETNSGWSQSKQDIQWNRVELGFGVSF